MSLCKGVNTTARKVVYCPYCSATNGAVKKAGALKIVHDKFRAKKTAEEMAKWKATFAPAVETQKELGIYINKAVLEDLNPLKVLDLFRRISDEVGVEDILNVSRKLADKNFRIASFWVCVHSLGDLKNTFGNIFLYLPFAYGHP